MKTRKWSRCNGAIVGLAALGLGACSSRQSFPTASTIHPEPRHPDAVAIDLAAALPAPSDRVDSSASAATLRAPVDPSPALGVVRRFFAAVARESSSDLRLLLTPDATVGPLSGAGLGPAASHWERRFDKLDYQSTGPQPVYRDSDIVLYRYRDVLGASGSHPPRPQSMTSDDVLVRVPIVIRRLGPDRLFGDVMLLVVRRTGPEQPRIRMILEDFQTP